jgi:hypothetical protein
MKIIDWIFDNLFIVLIVASVLGQLLKAIKGRRGDDEAPAEPPKEYEFEDPELAERTRKIREDIRRRIAERQRGGQTAAEPPPLVRDEPEVEAPVFEETPPPLVREVYPESAPEPRAAPSSRLEAQRAAEILEEQATMAERLREIEAMKAAAQRRAAFEALSVSAATVAREKTRGALLDDLRSPEALRRAFILREVLGPPVALR